MGPFRHQPLQNKGLEQSFLIVERAKVLTNGIHGDEESWHVHMLHIGEKRVSPLCTGKLPQLRNGSNVSCKYSGDSFLIRDGQLAYYSVKCVISPNLHLKFDEVESNSWHIDQYHLSSGKRESKIGSIEWDKQRSTERIRIA